MFSKHVQLCVCDMGSILSMVMLKWKCRLLQSDPIYSSYTFSKNIFLFASNTLICLCTSLSILTVTGRSRSISQSGFTILYSAMDLPSFLTGVYRKRTHELILILYPTTNFTKLYCFDCCRRKFIVYGVWPGSLHKKLLYRIKFFDR